MRIACGLLLLTACCYANAAQIALRVSNPPATGSLVLQVYDSASAFGDFRDPMVQARIPIAPDADYRLRGIAAGTVALLVFADENDNGVLDQNFIGLPTEAIWLSNDYRPKGPPSFERAAIVINEGDELMLDATLISVIDGGQWGAGIGLIARGSPYVGSDGSVLQPIPAITYLGERLQWLGPNIQYGLAGRGRVRLAAVANWRVGAYEEDDSAVLVGLGDRDGALMAGLGINADLPAGFQLGVDYRHDLLDRIGGGVARAQLSRSFVAGIARLSPTLGVNWLSAGVADYEYGVSATGATAPRPAYDAGSNVSVEIGIRALIEITPRWRAIVNVSVESLPDEITDSPIVDEDRIVNGFAALTYTF